MQSKTLPNIPSDVLRRMYQTPEVFAVIGPALAEALYQTVRRERPALVLEVGMAFGASTVAILTALEENAREENGVDGQLISLDPFQNRTWGGQGVENVEASGLGHRHRLIEELDYLALGDLIRDGAQFDFAYIDGRHNFDYVLIDFFLIDKLTRVGGLVAFNDCHHAGVEKVASFVTRHRHYVEVDVGLTPRRIVRKRWHRLIGRWVNTNDRYFRKLDEFEPDSEFYVDF